MKCIRLLGTQIFLTTSQISPKDSTKYEVMNMERKINCRGKEAVTCISFDGACCLKSHPSTVNPVLSLMDVDNA